MDLRLTGHQKGTFIMDLRLTGHQKGMFIMDLRLTGHQKGMFIMDLIIHRTDRASEGYVYNGSQTDRT